MRRRASTTLPGRELRNPPLRHDGAGDQMIPIHSRRALAGTAFGVCGAAVIIAFVGCASSLTVPDAEPVAVDGGPESPDASASDAPTEAAHCPEDDCVDYPEVCSAATLCGDDVAFD